MLGGPDEATIRSGGGATTIMPRNGPSGSSMPPGRNATLRCGSVLMTRGEDVGTRSGSTPEPGPVLLTPFAQITQSTDYRPIEV